MTEIRVLRDDSDPRSLRLSVKDGRGQWRALGLVGVLVGVSGKETAMEWAEAEPGALFRARGSGVRAELRFDHGQGPPMVELRISSDGARAVNYLRLAIDFLPDGKRVLLSEVLDDCHVPHLIPEPGLVVADQVWRSPALIVRRGGFGLALVPDLDALTKTRTAPWALDFDRVGAGETPRLTLAMLHHRLYRHVSFRSDLQREVRIPPDGLVLAGHLIVSTDADENFPREVQRFLWERYGAANYRAVGPQVLPLSEQADEALGRIFRREDFYFEFYDDGRRLGGVVAHAATTVKTLKPLGKWRTRLMSPAHGVTILTVLRLMNELSLNRGLDRVLRWSFHRHGLPFIREAMFTSWYNCLRTAYGARAMAAQAGDGRMVEQADLVKELCLAAPVEDGIFYSICTAPEGMVHWKRGTLSFMAIDDFHTPDQATTGYVMLRWHRDLEADPRLVDKARGLARFFIKHQLPSGAVPAWISGKGHRPLDRLRETASTAGPLMFMALLAAVDRDEEALESARRMASFLEREVLPDHRWFDYETFYSCSKQRKAVRCGRTGVVPQNGMSKCWAAEGMRLMYELTGEDRYRELMVKCLTDLLWLQQVWDAPYLSINTFGGFGSMNTDAEWNDARQGIIAPVLMDAYGVTGEAEYFERGVAALRACYTTMLHPAFRAVAPGNMEYYRESDRGAVYESYAHLGYDKVISGYLEPDWGGGTAAFATAHAALLYGDVLVDPGRGRAFGINGCAVTKVERRGDETVVEVADLVPGRKDWSVGICGGPAAVRLIVDGRDQRYEKI